MNIFQHFFSTFILTLLVCSVYAQETEEEKKVFINNEATINSDKLEYSPAFYEDGIVFISTKVSNKRFKMRDKRIDKNVMSIFRSQREENGLLLPPKPFSIELLSTVHEGPLTFDRTGETMFFTRNTTKDGRKIKAKDGITKMSIYQAENVAGKWVNITSLPFNDKEFNTVHPSISVEGDILYFASNREGGAGGMDIWSVKKVGDDWSEPRNLGPSVNTESDEIFPFVHADGTLYFASNGHIGFGGLDLFFSRPGGEEWSTATNLGAPFNSENDDFGFIIDRDKKNGYFSSSRSGGYGADDIYSFYVSGNLDELFDEDNRPTVVRDFTIMVSDNISSEMIEGATITYTNLDNLSITKAISGGSDPELQSPDDQDTDLLLRVPMEELGLNGVTDFLGKFPVALSTGNYAFVIEKPGFQSRQILVDTENSQEEIFVSLDKETMMANNGDNGNNGGPGTNTNGNTDPLGGTNPDGTSTGIDNGTSGSNTSSSNGSGGFSNTIREGSVFQLPNIYYNFNDASIRPDAKVDLDALAGFLSQYPDVEIELSSHTDSRGGSRYNKRLSQKRAENAVAYLIREGLPSNRLVAVGYGEEAIRNHCTNGKECTEDEHQYNRRTEVKILRMNNEINIQFVNDTSPPDYVDKADFATNSSGSSFTSNNNSGDYTVIAGVYANYENAQKKQGKLTGMGYDETSIKTVGNYYHIIVKTFSDRAQALSLQTNLKSDQIKSFLRE